MKTQIAELQAELTKRADAFPNETPLGVKLLGAHAVLRDGVWPTLFYEYEFLQRWVLASIVPIRSGDSIRISNLHSEPLAESLEQLNAFTFVRKTQKYYLFAGAAVLMLVFSVVSIVACLFTLMARRNWLWVIFAMFGVMWLKLN